MISVEFSKRSGQLYVVTKWKNGRTLSHSETIKKKDSIRKNIRAHMKAWNSGGVEVRWPDGSREYFAPQ